VVSQETRVFAGIGPEQAAALRGQLERSLPETAAWRPVPHAVFSVAADGAVVTCYASGKLVLQGADLDTFLARHLPEFTGAAAATAAAPPLPLTGTTLGSDEAGKGDYFGPLVVAAVCVEPAQEQRLREAGVTDSKRLKDQRVQLLAGMLERELPHERAQLMPELYNRAFERAGNLNRLLADMHARALARLHARCGTAVSVVVDRFAHPRLLESALARERPQHPPLLQVTQGERHVAVAAASIVARAGFLDGLRVCGDLCGVELPKGAGPAVDAAARGIAAIGGRELLAKVAKLHFRTTSKSEEP
jgi:ribonuclease HIII